MHGANAVRASIRHPADADEYASIYATPSPATVSPTPVEATQEAIFRAVGEWIADNHRRDLTPTVYVLNELIDHLQGAGAQLTPWGDRLTGASKAALESTVGEVVSLEFMDDKRSAVDPEASAILGCRPYFHDRTMVIFDQPLPVDDQFFVEVDVDQGCQGSLYYLQVEPTDAGFAVTRVVSEAS